LKDDLRSLKSSISRRSSKKTKSSVCSKDISEHLNRTSYG